MLQKMLCVIGLLIGAIDAFGQVKVFNLIAKMDGVMLTYNDDSLNFWGFGFNQGSASKITMPAPLIEVNEGDTVVINLYNPAVEAHTVHLHGLDADQANDGVPSTSFFVLQGDTGSYSFVATHAGNYIYHCHVTTVLHMQMGMFGPLIVRPVGGANTLWTGGPSFDKEYLWMAYDMDKSWHDDYTTIGSFVNYFPDHFMINNTGSDKIYTDNQIKVNGAVGENILLRIFNTGYGKQTYIFPEDLSVIAFTSDGRLLPMADTLDTLEVFPGERYGLSLSGVLAVEDTIEVHYQSLYDQQVWGKNKIPVSIIDVASATETFRSGELGPIVHPNPTRGSVNISICPGDTWKAILSSLTGKLIMRFDLSGEVTSLDLSNLAPGCYLLTFYRYGEWQYRELIIN